MSFSKARIQRFNDCENDVPAPGAYDPKFETKIRGLAIEKSERFNDGKSVASAECNLSISSKSTGNVVASFRTPQLPRKKVTVKPSQSCPKVKLEQKLKYESEHQLADLRVECINKNKTIQEHEKHIEDMKEEVRNLEQQLQELREKQTKVEEQHRKDIETMAQLQEEVLNDHDEKHSAEMETLRCQWLEVSEGKEREMEARKTMESELRGRIAELSKRVTTLEVELANKKKLNENKVKSLEIRITELMGIQDKLKQDYKTEISLLEKGKSQLISSVNDLTNERVELEAKLQKRQSVILELQAQLSTLQCELDELKAEYEKVIEDSAKQMTELTSKHQEEINQLEVKIKKEKQENELGRCHILEAEARVKQVNEENSFLKKELDDVQRLYKDVSHRLNQAYKELEDADKKHNQVLKKHKEDLDDMRKIYDEENLRYGEQLEDARQTYLKEIENLTMARDRELAEVKKASDKKIEEETKRMKEHADKMVENAEAVTRETLAACRAESEERVKRVIAESDAKVNAMIRDARTAVEEEMRLTAERYKACLARVEMERAALDEKLVQRDAEIARLSVTLEELKSSAETQESFGQSLQTELDRAETDLAEKKEELRALKDQMRAEAAEMVARRKRFEVIMAENQASVAALTQRLAQSNAEVERLQHELKRGEDEHRDLLSIMRNNSEMVHEQVQALMKQLDAKKGLVDQLESDSLNELQSMKSIFEAKIEDLKQIAAKEMTKLQTDCHTKTTQNTEMKNQLDEMAGRLKEAQALLLQLEETNDAQQLEISRIELLKTKLEEQVAKQKSSMEETINMLRTESAQQKIALDEANAKITELSDKNNQLEQRDRNLKENSHLLETIMEELAEEKARREAAEGELKKIVEYNDRLIKEYQEISEKYAEVVGHQNHRQRIKHLSQLKDKIGQLEQELHIKAKTIEQHQRTIEKLRAEVKRTCIKGKENLLGISKSAHSTPVTSPHKPVTPLRSRND